MRLSRGAWELAAWALLLLLAASVPACRSSAPVTPDPAAPVAVLAVTPAQGTAPLTVQFDASASHGAHAPLRFDYDFDGDGVYEALDAGAVASTTYTQAVSIQAAVRVTDPVSGANASASQTITVSAGSNALPVAAFSITPNQGTAPFSAHFDAAASTDSDGSLIRYDYDVNADGIWDAYDAGPAVDWNFATAGDFSVRLRVTDDRGGQASVVQPVHVNAAPTASLTADALTVGAGTTVHFDASASADADGALAKYEWDADGNGTFEINGGSSPLLAVLYPVPGVFHVAVRVTDSDNASAIAQVVLNVT